MLFYFSTIDSVIFFTDTVLVVAFSLLVLIPLEFLCTLLSDGMKPIQIVSLCD